MNVGKFIWTIYGMAFITIWTIAIIMVIAAIVVHFATKNK